MADLPEKTDQDECGDSGDKPTAKRVVYRESVFQYITTVFEGGTVSERIFAHFKHLAEHGLPHENVEDYAKFFLDVLNSLGLGPSEEAREYYLDSTLLRGGSKGSYHWKYLPIDKENAPETAKWADEALTNITILLAGQKRHPENMSESDTPGYWFQLGREVEELEVKIKLHDHEKTYWSQRKVQSNFGEQSRRPRKGKIDPEELTVRFPGLFDSSLKDGSHKRGAVVARAAKHFGVTGKAIRDRVNKIKDGS